MLRVADADADATATHSLAAVRLGHRGGASYRTELEKRNGEKRNTFCTTTNSLQSANATTETTASVRSDDDGQQRSSLTRRHFLNWLALTRKMTYRTF